MRKLTLLLKMNVPIFQQVLLFFFLGGLLAVILIETKAPIWRSRALIATLDSTSLKYLDLSYQEMLPLLPLEKSSSGSFLSHVESENVVGKLKSGYEKTDDSIRIRLRPCSDGGSYLVEVNSKSEKLNSEIIKKFFEQSMQGFPTKDVEYNNRINSYRDSVLATDAGLEHDCDRLFESTTVLTQFKIKQSINPSDFNRKNIEIQRTFFLKANETIKRYEGTIFSKKITKNDNLFILCSALLSALLPLSVITFTQFRSRLK